MKDRFLRRVFYRGLVLLKWIVQRLPIQIGVVLGGVLGWIAFWLAAHQRSLTLGHLKTGLGEETSRWQRFCIAERLFIHLGQNLAEVLALSQLKNGFLASRVEAQGLEKINQVLKNKKGGIVITPHFGNWELLAWFLAQNGYEGYGIARRLSYEPYDRLINECRQNQRIKILNRDHSPRELIKKLKQNQLIGLLPDQDIHSIEGVFVNFLGRLAYTPTSPVRLARATGAPLIPCFFRRIKGTRYELIVEDPIYISSGIDKQEDLYRYTQAWSQIFERYIRQYPWQWAWMHPRWKTTLKNNDVLCRTVLLFLSILWMGRCALYAEIGPSDQDNRQKNADQEIWNFSLSGYEPTGKKKWEVNGNTASIFSQEQIQLEEVKATSYNSAGNITLSSKTGVFDKIQNDIFLKDNVIGKTSDGATLRTESLAYQANSGLVKTDDFVEVEQEAMKTFGYGAEAQPEQKKIALKKNVTIIAKPSTTITCQGPLEIDYKSRIATLHNQIRVIDSRGEILSDLMQVYFDGDRQTISRVAAQGNVKITQGENVTYCDHADYDVTLGKITLTEKPQMQLTPTSLTSADELADQTPPSYSTPPEKTNESSTDQLQAQQPQLQPQ